MTNEKSELAFSVNHRPGTDAPTPIWIAPFNRFSPKRESCDRLGSQSTKLARYSLDGRAGTDSAAVSLDSFTAASLG